MPWVVTPWAALSPRHIQQNSCLHFEQVIALHPLFFSMGHWHFGQSWVCNFIQLNVSESFLLFTSHYFIFLHMAGSWPSNGQLGHEIYPQRHRSSRTPSTFTRKPQSGLGQRFHTGFTSTNAFTQNLVNFSIMDSLMTDFSHSGSTMSCGHLACMQVMQSDLPLLIDSSMWSFQHWTQKKCRQSSAFISTSSPESPHITHSSVSIGGGTWDKSPS